MKEPKSEIDKLKDLLRRSKRELTEYAMYLNGQAESLKADKDWHKIYLDNWKDVDQLLSEIDIAVDKYRPLRG